MLVERSRVAHWSRFSSEKAKVIATRGMLLGDFLQWRERARKSEAWSYGKFYRRGEAMAGVQTTNAVTSVSSGKASTITDRSVMAQLTRCSSSKEADTMKVEILCEGNQMWIA
jgi:hypothetical protein